MQRPRDWSEGRRLRAWELKQQDWKQRHIARALAASESAVSQWCRRAREHGVAGLRRRKHSGPRPRLTTAQRQRLLAVLARGAEAYQFRGDIWTTKRVAAVIREEFGVRYHPAHVSRVRRACGWSARKPIKRASRRDEVAIRAWREVR